MGAGLPDFNVVNLDDLEKHFQAGENVTIEAVKERVLSISGRESKLPLKVRRGEWEKEQFTMHGPVHV